MDPTRERWEKAYERAKEYLGYYKDIGPAGIIGAMIICQKIQRYEAGDRSEALLEELEAIE
jgi:hypothetical protein